MLKKASWSHCRVLRNDWSIVGSCMWIQLKIACHYIGVNWLVWKVSIARLGYNKL